MKISKIFGIPCLLILAACAAQPLLPGATAIVLSKAHPAPGCQFVGEVRGTQGNFWTAEFTSDEDLIIGARNELRNAAFQIRANYVQIESESFSDNTADDSLGGLYSVVIIGNAYYCDDPELALK